MNPIDAWLQDVQQWYADAVHCAGQPIPVAVCRPFWAWVITAALVIGALAVIIGGWKIISYRIKHAAALRAAAARQDVGAINASRSDGYKAYTAQLGGEEVERRSREAAEKRRLGQAAGK